MQVANAAAQVDPEVFVVENAEIFVHTLQQCQAVIVKRGGLDDLAPEQSADAVAHFVCGIDRIGEGKDFVRMGVTFPDQLLDAVGENGSLARCRPQPPPASARSHARWLGAGDRQG